MFSFIPITCPRKAPLFPHPIFLSTHQITFWPPYRVQPHSRRNMKKTWAWCMLFQGWSPGWWILFVIGYRWANKHWLSGFNLNITTMRSGAPTLFGRELQINTIFCNSLSNVYVDARQGVQFKVPQNYLHTCMCRIHVLNFPCNHPIHMLSVLVLFIFHAMSSPEQTNNDYWTSHSTWKGS